MPGSQKSLRARRAFAFVGGVSTLVVALVAQPARAQTAAAAEENTPGAEDIIVTARKREENLQSVPVAVTAFSGETLEKRGVTSFTDLAQSNPNVKISAVQGSPVVGTSIAIRGNLQGSGTIQVDASVGLYLDGHVISHSFGMAGITVDVASVQTLKGPQGTLFGRNTTGGAMLVQTVDPKIGQGFEGYVQGDLGTLNTRRFGGAVNVPLGEKAALRLVYQNNYRGNFASYSNGLEAGRKKEETFRAKLLVEPTDTTTILLSAERSKESGTGAINLATQPNTTIYKNIPLIPAVRVLSVPDAAATIPIDVRNGNHFGKADSTLLGATVTQDIGAGTLKFLASYHKYDVAWFQDLPPSFGYTEQFKPNNKDFSGELQYNTELFNGFLDLTSGLYYYKETIHEDQNTFLYSRDSRTSRFLTQHSRSASGYAQATAHLVEGLNLTAGIRYTDDKKRGSLLSASIVSAPGTLPGSPGYVPLVPGTRAQALLNPIATKRLKDNRTNYMVSLDYKVTDGILVYASTATGYRAGGTGVDRALEPSAANYLTAPSNPLYYQTTFFLPESLQNYEVGVKSQFFNRVLTLNAAAFQQDYKNYQYSGIDPITRGRVTGNADAKIKGFELEGTLRLPTRTVLSGSYGYTDARVKQPGTGFDDNHLPGIPKTTWSLTGEQRFDVGEGEVELVATYSWRDSYLQYIVEPNSFIRPVGLLNLSATYSHGPISFTVYGNNVTNERYYNSIVYSAPVINLGTLAVPRIVGARAKYVF